MIKYTVSHSEVPMQVTIGPKGNVMGKIKGRKVLAVGSIVRAIGGNYIHQEGRVISILGGPHEFREVTVSLFGQTEPVVIPQHHLRVTRSPEGWKPGMKPCYNERASAEPVTKGQKAAKTPKQKTPRMTDARKNQGKHKVTKKRYSRSTVNGLEIPKFPGGYHSSKRRSK